MGSCKNTSGAATTNLPALQCLIAEFWWMGHKISPLLRRGNLLPYHKITLRNEGEILWQSHKILPPLRWGDFMVGQKFPTVGHKIPLLHGEIL